MCILSHPLIKQACSKVGRIFYYINLRNFPPCFVFFILFKNWNKLIYIIILCSGVQQLFDKWMISSRADCYKKVELNKIPEVQLTLEQVRSQGSANAGWDPRAQSGHGMVRFALRFENREMHPRLFMIVIRCHLYVWLCGKLGERGSYIVYLWRVNWKVRTSQQD